MLTLLFLVLVSKDVIDLRADDGGEPSSTVGGFFLILLIMFACMDWEIIDMFKIWLLGG